MAEGEETTHLKGVSINDDQLLDGHKGIYQFKVHRLDAIERTFYPLEYNTYCPTIPTTWELSLKYERMTEEGGEESYTFSIRLKRKDSSNHRMKATLEVVFSDDDDSPIIYPISKSKGRMISGEEIEASIDGIMPTTLSELVGVEVTITIQACHTNTDFEFASYVKKNSKNLPKL